MKLLFIDTETTGFIPRKHGVVQIAGIVDIDGSISEEFNFTCQPFEGQEYTDSALEVTGLTKARIATFDKPQRVHEKVVRIWDNYINKYDKTDKFYMVGQNIKFDHDHLNQWFKACGNNFMHSYIDYHLIDIMAATALMKLAGAINVPNMKLGTVAEYLGIELKAHDALEDVRATRNIFYTYISAIKGKVKL